MFLQNRRKPGQLNKISTLSDILLNIPVLLFSIMSLLPILLVIIVSLTDEEVVLSKGFNFLPQKPSFYAYSYMFKYSSGIFGAYAVTIFVTVVGTIVGLLFCSMYAYAISRKSFKSRNVFAFIVYFTMLFNGGMVAFYIICSRLFHLNNSLLALILPYSVNAFYILILRTFLANNVPESVIESAKIDGAGELTIFFRIVIWISLPGMAAIGLMLSLQYWNDWFLPFLFIDNQKLFSLQYLLYKIQSAITFLNSYSSSGRTGVDIGKLPAETSRMAMVIITIGPIVLAYPYFQKYFIKGLTLGAIRG